MNSWRNKKNGVTHVKQQSKLLCAVFAPYAAFSIGAALLAQYPVMLWQVAASTCIMCMPLTAWVMFEICPGGKTGKYVFNVLYVLFPHLIFYCLVGFLGGLRLFYSTNNIQITTEFLVRFDVEFFAKLFYIMLMAGGIAWLIAVDLIRKAKPT